ncbi:MAG: substrate-binding domain-containing protein [Lachnospiraceae bacterium]|nr:substrate-binding domain-containing protein [Lachnospiraceae bacterium]
MSDSENRKTIGLVIEDVFSDFSKEIIHSVVYAMRNRTDMQLVVVAGRQVGVGNDRNNQHCYKAIANSVYSMVQPCKFDGLIIALPNMKGVHYENYEEVPKVFIASDEKRELTVNYNDEMGLKEALDYLFRVKGVNNICMLGGRDDNTDAQKRKKIFMDYLKGKGLDYSEDKYEAAEMSIKSEEQAKRLLDRNPDVQAIFCVNDQVAYGLYKVMKERNLTPGKDIDVFGFDNTRLATDMIPALSSIGADAASLGQNALDILIKRMNDDYADSVTIPTCLFGRESMDYKLDGYTAKELAAADDSYINRMFDDCFYRYRNEIIDTRAIDLKRLFYAFISKMIASTKKRKMDDKLYEEMCRLIDIFFDNDAMKYTDMSRFVTCLGALQSAMKEVTHAGPVNDSISALFSRMRDKALLAQASWWNTRNLDYDAERTRIREFIAETMVFPCDTSDKLEHAISNFDLLGLKGAAFYMYEKPVIHTIDNPGVYPDRILLKCTVVSGKLNIIKREDQLRRPADMFKLEGLAGTGKGLIAFPVFSGTRVFGILICALSRDITEKGEYLACQLGRVIGMCVD